MSTNLLSRARAGDGDAFRELVDPHRRELQVHCYRILGSAQDAEDALQEALLAAWLGIGGYEGRASIRTWLYRVATNRCLNALRSAGRRPSADWTRPEFGPPEPTRLGEVMWLEPCPDVLLEGLADEAPGPEARYEVLEAISLAFVTALQLLPPRQRAILILRDVLGFRAAEVAQMLDITQEAVSSALKRARATMQHEHSRAPGTAAPQPGSDVERELIDRFAKAFQSCDVGGVVALLTDDAWLRMPPVPLEYQGHELATRFFTAAFRPDRRFRMVPTRANGQPAFGIYLHDPQAQIAHASGLLVISLAGAQISAITRFDNSVLPNFGLPRTLPT